MGNAQKQLTLEQYNEIARLAEIEEKFAYFNITGYAPHAKQEAVHKSNALYRVLVAGRRSGKSFAASKEAEFILLQPNKRIWVVAPTYSLADKVFREIYYELIIKKTLPMSAVIKKSENNKIIKIGFDKDDMPCGDHNKIVATSEIIGMSADNPISLLGEGVDLLIFDECAKSSAIIWEKYLSATLADRNGRAIFPTTPEGQNWVYDLFKRGNSNAHPDWESFHFESTDNPHISQSYLDQQKRNLPKEVYDQEHRALFTAFKGQVYKDLNEMTHGISRKDYPEFTRIRLGIDFGFTNPTAILVIANDNDGRYYIIEEHYETGMHESDIVEVVAGLQEKYKDLYDGGVADSSEPDKVEALEPYGIEGTYKNKDSVKQGVIAVAGAIKVQDDGRPRLYIDYDCFNCWREIPNYKYKEQRNINAKEEPQKIDDHTCDAARYLIFSDMDSGGATTSNGYALEL
jgi:PBSX family phage terminase large subunit